MIAYGRYKDWLRDLEHTPEVFRIGFIRQSLRNKVNLHIFGRYFFPHIIKGDNEVPYCHIELTVELGKRENSAIIFPRGFAKSTWEKIDTIHDIVYQIEEVILYISATLTDAMQHVESIRGEIENNALLIHVYGALAPPYNLRSRKWTNRHIEATNGVNLIARGRNKGRGVNVKNKRPTKIVVDDAEDDQQVRNPDQRAKFHDWLYDVIFPSLDAEHGFIKMIGTNIHELCEVYRFYKKHGGIFKRAIENGRSIWPARFTEEKLAQIKEDIGTRSFNREFMNNPSADEEANFPCAWIENRYYASLPTNTLFECVVYIDPQSGEKSKADEFAISVLYRERKGVHRYLVEQVAGRKSQLEQAKEVVRAWLRHKDLPGVTFRVVGVEKVLTQVAVYQILVDWKAKRVDFNQKDTKETDPDYIDESDRNLPLVAVQTNKDKKARLEVFEPDIERGEIHIRQEMEVLLYQLLFTIGTDEEHDDRADSLVGALELSGREYNTEDSKPPGFGETGETEYNKTITGGIMRRSF